MDFNSVGSQVTFGNIKLLVSPSSLFFKFSESRKTDMLTTDSLWRMRSFSSKDFTRVEVVKHKTKRR